MGAEQTPQIGRPVCQDGARVPIVKKALADIVGPGVARYEVYPEPTDCECQDQGAELSEVECRAKIMNKPFKMKNCMEPLAPTALCDDILGGRVCDSTLDTWNDRCKKTDILHQKYKRHCGFQDEKVAKLAAEHCCQQLDTKVCADYFCTSDWLYDQGTSNFFKYAEPRESKTRCNYPFPCKAHCFYPPPYRSHLYDSVCRIADPPVTPDQSTKSQSSTTCSTSDSHQTSASPAQPRQFQYHMQKRNPRESDQRLQDAGSNVFVGTGWGPANGHHNAVGVRRDMRRNGL